MKVTRTLLQVIGVVLLMGGSATSQADQLTWDDMMPQVLRHNQAWEQVLLNTSVEVFEPFVLKKEEPPQPMLMHGFLQTIYWKSGQLLAIETRDQQNELLHFYYEALGDIEDALTQSQRPFAQEDIFPHYLKFIVQRPKDWESVAEMFGIQSREISLFRDLDASIYYRIGDLQTQNFALIDEQSFLLKALQYEIQSQNGVHTIRIQFKEMTPYGDLQYPKSTEYLIDGKLFKRVTVSQLNVPETLPLRALRQSALKWSTPAMLSIGTDFTQ